MYKKSEKIVGPSVSIVMVNYNGLRYLKRTIGPILKLSYSNCEFIIVDNGSNDGSLEYIKEFNEIRLLKSPRTREKNFACNYAIEKARGKYILLCDNDLLCRDINLIENLLEFIANNEKIKIGSVSLAFYNEGTDKSKGFGGFFHPLFFTYINNEILISKINELDGIRIGYPHGIGIFIEKKKWIEAGGYDSNLKFGGDDSDLGAKLWLLGYENKLYAKTLQIHIGMAERRDNKKYKLKLEETFCACLYTMFKNFSIPKLIFSIWFYFFYSLLKSIKQSMERKCIGIFLSFFRGWWLFYKKIPIVLRERKKIQAKRISDKDIFFKIKPPKFIKNEKLL